MGFSRMPRYPFRRPRSGRRLAMGSRVRGRRPASIRRLQQTVGLGALQLGGTRPARGGWLAIRQQELSSAEQYLLGMPDARGSERSLVRENGQK
jgi:hypothetical protein